MAVYNHWTGLLEWTTGLTFLHSKKICLPCILHYIRFPTWLLASLPPALILSSMFQPYVDRQQSISAYSNCNADWTEYSIHNVDMRVFTWSLETVASLDAGHLLWEDGSSTLFVGTIVRFASQYITYDWWISSCWTHCKSNLEPELNMCPIICYNLHASWAQVAFLFLTFQVR